MTSRVEKVMQTAVVAKHSTIVFAIVAALSSATGAQSGHELFQQALSKERAEGKLQDAIALYQRVVDVASADHALAAKALLQLGRCHEQLGNAAARSAYERLIARYPDQTDLVAQARTRLAGLATAPPNGTPISMTVQPLPDVNKAGPLLSVSPDGTKAIVWDFSKGQNHALYDVQKKQARLLTDLDWLGGWTDEIAVWSPDALRVAYLHAKLGNEPWELRTTTLDGRSSLVHQMEPGRPVGPVGWTPDGRTLVVLMARPDKTAAIATLPATGGQLTPLRSLGWSYDWGHSSSKPRLAPDGRFIAYLEGETGQRDVHVVSLDGREGYRITNHPGDDFMPIWSRDSRHLAFMSDRLGSVALWAVEVKDGKPAGQPAKLKDGMQSTRLVDWTDRGIFYDQLTDTRDLYTVPVDPVEGRPSGAPRLIPYSRTGRNFSPSWSPDGERLAFVSSAATEPNRRYVVVMSPDGSQAREFLIPTTRWGNPFHPGQVRWFGDGRGLGFSGQHARGGPAVFRLRLESGEWDTIPLPPGSYQTSIEWNRDGSAFYFSRSMTDAGIFERAVNSDTERLVHRAPPFTQPYSLEFSPDRKWLAFQTETAPDGVTILVVDIATGETRTVLERTRSSDSSRLTLMGWTPSGDLLVRRRSTAGSQFQVVSVNGGNPRPIEIPSFAAVGPGDTDVNSLPRLSPAGRWMALVRANQGVGTFIHFEAFLIEHPLAAVRSTAASR
jgi:Tol biopolymer transport system component